MSLATAAAVATINIPAIYRPSADADDYLNREIEKWFAHHIAQLSDNRPESRILSPSSITERSPTPSKFYADELLDWDAAIEVAPMRPSGTLTVTLEYAGRGTPSPTRDPWD